MGGEEKRSSIKSSLKSVNNQPERSANQKLSIDVDEIPQREERLNSIFLHNMEFLARSKQAISQSLSALRSSAMLKSTSRIAPAFNFMKIREQYRVVVDGIDYTPDNLVDPGYVTINEGFTHAAFDVKSAKSDNINKESLVTSKPSKVIGVRVLAATVDIDEIHIDSSVNTQEGITTGQELVQIERAPSAYYLPKDVPLKSYPPKVFVVLKETPTHFLIDLPQLAVDKDTVESASVEASNELYQYMTVGKGRNRKKVQKETQTVPTMTQSRHTLATRPQKKNAACFASVWDMHDTYAGLQEEMQEEETDEMVLYQTAAKHLLRKKKPKLGHDIFNLSFQSLAQSPNFLDAALITQRVLASKSLSNQQKRFRGLVDTNPYSLDLVYIYTMRPLWSFVSEETKGRTITCISFNPINENIVAVGYGKFSFAEKRRGLVCVWNTKNPCKPERIYWFENPLTSLSFSTLTPNALALGFCNGDVMIIDVTSYTVRILAKSKRDSNPSFEPIWVTEWHISENNSQYVMTVCQDGRICKFVSTKTHDFICVSMMRISNAEGKLRGIDLMKPCRMEDVAVDRNPAALCLKWQPSSDNIYLVGTEEGCIHRCSTHYMTQHVDVFRAHCGAVYNMEFSPFKDSLMLTCGADGAIRLWIDGIDTVIITLTCDSPVLGATFSPINATVILSVSGNILSVWDLRRKTHIPCAKHVFPANVTLTYIKFSTSGDNVFVGDSEGCVHTFHLEDTPIPPFYQRRLLDNTIKKALCTRPQLLRKIQKMEDFAKK